MAGIVQQSVPRAGEPRAGRAPSDVRYLGYRLALEGLSRSGLARIAAPWTGGLGAILTLHHVRPARADGFQPNRILEITPDFLDALLSHLARRNIEFVSLAEAVRRAREPAGTAPGRRFACLTFDDGYRDNVEHARPILTRHGAPWTLFVTTRFADGDGELWWLALEAAIARAARLEVDLGSGRQTLDCSSAAAKAAAWRTLYWRLRALPEPELLAQVRGIAAAQGVDLAGFARDLCLRWDELRALATDPLVTIGAHTVSHPRLATLPEAAARSEIAASRALIADRLGRAPAAFAYPVGDPGSAGPREFRLAREAGFDCAVTTRPGVVAAGADPFALPRISLNGLFQQPRLVEALLSGLPFAALRGLRGR